MNTRLAPALSIDTAFVAEKDTKIKDIMVDGGSGRRYQPTVYDEKSFSDMNADEIQGFINAQYPSDGLSYDAQVMRNDIISWILERRMNDESSALERDEEIYDITNATLDLSGTILSYITNRNQSKLEGKFSEARLSVKTDLINTIGEVVGFNPEGQLSNEAKKDIEKIIGHIESVFTNLLKPNIIDSKRAEILKNFFEDNYIEFENDRDGSGYDNYIDDYISRVIVVRTVDIPDPSDPKDVAKSSKSYFYHCNINCEIKEHNEIYVGYNEYQSPHFTDAIDATTYSLLLLVRKLLGIMEDHSSKSQEILIIFRNLLEFGKDKVMPLAKSVQTHRRKNKIREFSRALDLAGNVGTVKEGTLAYVKGGFFIDENNAIRLITEETGA